MSDDFDGCPECLRDEEEIEISQSRWSHINFSINLGKAVTFQNPIDPTMSARKMWDPNAHKEACVNPACGEWQEDIGRTLDSINESLEDVARTGDWSHIDKSKVEQLAQLSDSALDRIDEQGIEWDGVEKQIEWKKIEDQIDDFEENFKPAAEYTVSLHNLRGTPNPGIDKLPETASSLENLTELRDRIEPEVAADVETVPNESEEEEQGPVERLEEEIETLKSEKEERIEERKAERETRIEELKAEVEELKAEKQARIEESKAEIDELKAERDDRIEWREEEIEELSEENEEQTEELKEQIWEVREDYETRIDERWDQVTGTRKTYDEQITETRAANKERITEIREEYDEQIAEVREDYESRIDTRRTQITEQREQDEDKTIETSTERDRDGGKDAVGRNGPAGRATGSASTGVASEQANDNANRSETAGEPTEAGQASAMANGGTTAGNGSASSTGKPEQDGESKQTTESSSRTSGFDPNRTLSQEEIRELELNSDWSQYNQPSGSNYTSDPDQTNESDEPTRAESSREKNSEKGDGEPGGLA